MADCVVFKVEKKQSEEDCAGERHFIWLSVCTVNGVIPSKAPGTHGRSSLAAEEHRALQVSAEAYGRVKRGDRLTMAIIRDNGPDSRLERL